MESFLKSASRLLLVTIIGLLLYGKAHAFNTSAYFPLISGYSWTYQKNGSGAYTQTVLPGTTLVNGVATTAVISSPDNITSYYTNDSNGILEHKEYTQSLFIPGYGYREFTAVFNPPLKYADANATIGTSVSSSGTCVVTISGFGNFILNYSATSTPEAFETITVPAGTFETVRVVTTTNINGWSWVLGGFVNITSTDTMWVAKNIGAIKETGMEDNVAVTYTATGWSFPTVALSPGSVDFGGQMVGTNSSSRTITLKNPGGSALSISSITTTGNFSRTTTCGSTLASKAQCAIDVVFSPTVGGNQTGSIVVNTSNALGSPHTVNLSGTGTPPDTTPDAFNFTAQSGVALSAPVVSNSITVSGITAASPIIIVGGEYSINGGPWTSTPSTVTNGQAVAVRLTSSSSYSTTTSATLTIGGVSGTFSITTAARDITPDQFTFTAVTGAPINSWVESNAVVISGINDAAPMTVTGQGEYSVNGGAWTSNPGTVNNGDSVKVRLTSSGSPLTTVDTKLVINGVQGTFSVTTAVIDTTPDAFSFTSVANVPLSAVTTSNAVTISGINTATPLSITGGEYSINGGAWSIAGGSIINGQTVAVRTTSLAQFGSTWVTLTVGGVSAKFYVTTAPQAGTPSLNTPWWRADTGYNSWAVVQNISNTPVQVIATIASYSGVSYTDPIPVIIGAGQVTYIRMNDYANSIGGKTSGALQLHYTGNAGGILADMFSLGAEGYSYLATMRDNSGTGTTLNTPWWRADGAYKSWAVIQNISNNPVQASVTVISYSGVSYTDPTPVTIGPRQVTYVYLNNYVGNLGGKTSGALKVSHNGAPGDVIAQMLSLGPEGYCYSKPLRDNSGTGTILSAPWWRADGAYKSWAVVQNISNSPVEVTPRVISYSGVSYTDAPITIGAQQVTYIYLNNYVGNIGGKTSGALELSHNGLAGDVIAEMLSLGPEGYAYTTSIREGNPASGTTLHTPWWRADGSYKSWAIIQNTSNNPVQATLKAISYSGVSYTDTPITIGARQVTYVYLNNYAGHIGGKTSGALEVSHTGNAGDVIAEMLSLGPNGYSYSTPMR